MLHHLFGTGEIENTRLLLELCYGRNINRNLFNGINIIVCETTVILNYKLHSTRCLEGDPPTTFTLGPPARLHCEEVSYNAFISRLSDIKHGRLKILMVINTYIFIGMVWQADKTTNDWLF